MTSPQQKTNKTKQKTLPMSTRNLTISSILIEVVHIMQRVLHIEVYRLAVAVDELHRPLGNRGPSLLFKNFNVFLQKMYF